MAGDGVEPERTSPASRRRVALAGALVLGALIVAIVIASSSGSSSNDQGSAGGARSPGECLKAWNRDVVALNYGVHNSISHGYNDVQVGFMPEAGSAALSNDPGSGRCAVVFAAKRPDPEPAAAGQIHIGDRWVPLSGLVGPRELAELQVTAVTGANAKVTQYGKLVEGASEPARMP